MFWLKSGLRRKWGRPTPSQYPVHTEPPRPSRILGKIADGYWGGPRTRSCEGFRTDPGNCSGPPIPERATGACSEKSLHGLATVDAKSNHSLLVKDRKRWAADEAAVHVGRRGSPIRILHHALRIRGHSRGLISGAARPELVIWQRRVAAWAADRTLDRPVEFVRV